MERGRTTDGREVFVRHMKVARDKTQLAAMLVVLAIAVVLFFPGVRTKALVVYENVMLTFDPSAERAYAYGIRHFDATDPNMYDRDRAEHLLNTALQYDPHLPNVQHQLARIAFLHGDYTQALARINNEIRENRSHTPSAYYVRGLIKGFMSDYVGSAVDYETYLRTDPTNWAAINDYAWVLLKDDRPKGALVAADWGLRYWPENPWLLNTKAIAHFELGQLALAEEAAEHAARAVKSVDEKDWLLSYPGNDPLIAKEGLEAFRSAVEENIHSIKRARGGGD